ncbi:uroporphyrinogen-III synthase, partial [Mangrovicoccus sp. HB182678]|nr:uroporphyrinogen-III synthase [Mangrovicoccus algicola]
MTRCSLHVRQLASGTVRHKLAEAPVPHVPILLTRPEPGAGRFAAEIRTRLGPGPVVVSPVMEIVPRPVAPLPGGLSGLILTSGAALVPGLDLPPGLPAWCVGARTAA